MPSRAPFAFDTRIRSMPNRSTGRSVTSTCAPAPRISPRVGGDRWSRPGPPSCRGSARRPVGAHAPARCRRSGGARRSSRRSTGPRPRPPATTRPASRSRQSPSTLDVAGGDGRRDAVHPVDDLLVALGDVGTRRRRRPSRPRERGVGSTRPSARLGQRRPVAASGRAVVRSLGPSGSSLHPASTSRQIGSATEIRRMRRFYQSLPTRLLRVRQRPPAAGSPAACSRRTARAGWGGSSR